MKEGFAKVLLFGNDSFASLVEQPGGLWLLEAGSVLEGGLRPNAGMLLSAAALDAVAQLISLRKAAVEATPPGDSPPAGTSGSGG